MIELDAKFIGKQDLIFDELPKLVPVEATI